MKELTTGQAARFLNISPERVRRMADIGRIKVRKIHGRYRRYPISELERIKKYLNGDYVYPARCTACGKLFERTHRRFRVCPDCASITKECECGCGTLIRKYSNKVIDGKVVIGRLVAGHHLNIYYDKLRKDPKAWQAMCDERKSWWRDPEFRQKVWEGRLNCEHIGVLKIDSGHRTDIETLVDKELERLGIAFEPDYRIGVFFIDCAILSHRVAIEVDGTYFHDLPKIRKQDHKKDGYLAEQGWKVVRLSGKEIMSDVKQAIANKVLPMLV